MAGNMAADRHHLAIPEIIPERKRRLSRDSICLGHRSAQGSRAGSPTGSIDVDDALYEWFRDDDTGLFQIDRFVKTLKESGILLSDPRLKEVRQKLGEIGRSELALQPGEELSNSQLKALKLDRDAFKKTIMNCMLLVTKALNKQFVVADWPSFVQHVGGIYDQVKLLKGGQNAQYIPELARMNPDYFGVSVCSVDGQRHSWGDTTVPFCIQSISKAFTYAMNLNDQGSDAVHEHIGTEPSGRLFNEICLDKQNRPHNPMINAGAIVCSSLVRNKLCQADRYNFMIDQYRRMSGGEYVNFSNATLDRFFLSERETADRNYCLSYYMREYGNFDRQKEVRDILEFYFQQCSIMITCDSLSVMAATLANGGVCPITGERVLSNESCRHTLSLMHSCGMYDYSGMFAFKVGLPAKSGVGGGIIVIIPNLCGFCTFSPPLDAIGNSFKGVKFYEALVTQFNFHNFDNLLHSEARKFDPRRRPDEKATDSDVSNLLFSVKVNDLHAVRGYWVSGVCMDDADYDGRTALHIAAAEGHADIVRFLLERCNVNPEPHDRWGHTPLEDANVYNHPDCEQIISEHV